MRTPAADLLHLFKSVLQKRFAKNGFPHKIRPAPSVASGDPALQDGLHLFPLFPEDPAHEEPDDTATPPHAGRKRCRTERAGAGWLDWRCTCPGRSHAQAVARLRRLEERQCADRAQRQHPGNPPRSLRHQRDHAVEPVVCSQQFARTRRRRSGEPRCLDRVHRGRQKPAHAEPGRAQDAGHRHRRHGAAVLGQWSGVLPQQAQRYAVDGGCRRLCGVERCAAAQRGGRPGWAGGRHGVCHRNRW